MQFNWECPHCHRAQTVVDQKYHKDVRSVGVPYLAEGLVVIEHVAIGCANPECGRLTLRVRVGKDAGGQPGMRVSPDALLFAMQIIPFGSSKPQPDFIPGVITEDYYEACLIRDLSPKAAATLSRRCLQGMIRDFCKISKARLLDEIKELRSQIDAGTADRAVTSESVAAIDHVRSIGNIGAHMERDVNEIIEVDAGEVQYLIGLIEMLFDEWYGARHRRQQQLAMLEQIAVSKRPGAEAANVAGNDDGAAPIGATD